MLTSEVIPFLYCLEKNWVIGAELRGTCNTQWRGVAPGSPKNWVVSILLGKVPEKWYYVNLPLTLYPVLYSEYTAISTSGVAADPAWLHNFITNGSEIYCGFDTDKTGDMIANKMIKQYPSIKKLRPPCHDWNKMLQQSFHPLIQPPI